MYRPNCSLEFRHFLRRQAPIPGDRLRQHFVAGLGLTVRDQFLAGQHATVPLQSSSGCAPCRMPVIDQMFYSVGITQCGTCAGFGKHYAISSPDTVCARAINASFSSSSWSPSMCQAVVRSSQYMGPADQYATRVDGFAWPRWLLAVGSVRSHTLRRPNTGPNSGEIASWPGGLRDKRLPRSPLDKATSMVQTVTFVR